MERLADRTVATLLDELAAPTPAPGGGSSAALTCAVGAGLAQMTAALPADRPDLDRVARAGQLRERALALAERELGSYEPVLEAIREPADRPGRERRLAAALVQASEAPAEIAATAAEVSALAAEIAARAGPAVRGDAVTAVLLAEAAARAAAGLVELNLARLPDDPRLAGARSAAERAGAARERVLA